MTNPLTDLTRTIHQAARSLSPNYCREIARAVYEAGYRKPERPTAVLRDKYEPSGQGGVWVPGENPAATSLSERSKGAHQNTPREGK